MPRSTRAAAVADHPALAPCDARTTIEELRPAERVLVNAARAWVAAPSGEEAMPDRGGGGGDIASAMRALDGLLRRLAARARRPIDIRAPADRRLGADEALLLFAVANGQRGFGGAMQRVAEEWLPAASVPPAAAMLAVLARRLGEAGDVLPLRADRFSSLGGTEQGCHAPN